jgi:chemotaxis signal transduction protein
MTEHLNNISNIAEYMKNVKKFETNLNDISKKWEQLALLSQLGSTNIDMNSAKDNFNSLSNELITHLTEETMKKVENEMSSKSQVAVDIVIRNLFERTADIGFLATDDDVRKFLLKIKDIKSKIKQHENDADDTIYRTTKMSYKKELKDIKLRFEEYVAKYSVYYDIVLFDTNGVIVAKLDDTNEIKRTQDDIIDLCKTTNDDYLETFKYHDFIPHRKKSLVYTYKVTSSNNSDEIIGFLSLCFKFRNEMENIFSNLVNHNNQECLLLLDKDGVVIASSDKYHIPVDVKLDVVMNDRFKITTFGGRRYLSKTSKTNGYEGFFGLGWLGHIMIPIDYAFDNYDEEISLEKNVLQSIMKNEHLFTKDLLNIPNKAQVIQEELDRAVWNGNVMQSDKDSNSNEFSRSILREIRHTGEHTKKTFSDSIEKLNQTIISSLLGNVSFLASLSIDIMDRNLYERANDCRWWALTSTFRELLDKGEPLTQDNLEEIESILAYINSLYTVYTNLFVFDKNGKILAVSNPKEKLFLNTRIYEDWIHDIFKLKDSSRYSVSHFDKTQLYDNKNTYIYGAAIRGENTNQIVGGIGIVFDSTPQFKDMLNDALPKDKTGMFSMFVHKDSRKIISCSDDSHNIGDILNIDEDFYKLKNGDNISKIVEYAGKYYILGARCSSGYREYKSSLDEYVNDVIAFVFIEAGNIEHIEEKNSLNHYYNYNITARDEVVEIATFYVGSKWLGVQSVEIEEAISLNHLEDPITMDDGEHHFKGTVSYKDYIISVLDIRPFINVEYSKSKPHDIILVSYNQGSTKHTIGIVVDKLGEILRVPSYNIKKLDQHLIGGGMLGESIVKPPLGDNSKGLLTILNISKIGKLDAEENHSFCNLPR